MVKVAKESVARRYTDILEKFEISGTASKVYIALLEIGKSSADKIAKKIGTYKPNVYDALKRLQEIGLCTVIHEENKKLFLATNPAKLPQILEDIKQSKISKIDELKKEISSLMPELSAKYNSIKEKELFEIYRGRKAYKAIMNEIVREKPKIWKGFGNLQVQGFFPVEFQKWFKTVNIKLFSNKSKEVEQRLKESKKITKVEISWLPKEVYMPIVWVIFGENVLIIIYEPDIIVMRIKSKQVVKTYSNQFDYLWKKYD